MSILNQQRNQKGVQTLGTEFQDNVGAGHGYMIPHTNGNVYCVFARNYLNAVAERRLFISVSSDHGTTWSTPTQLTSGFWDDDPCGLQLDTSSTTSDIGIVFGRATNATTINGIVLTRIVVEIAGLTVTSPVDPITGSPAQYKYPSIVKTTGGYAIFAIQSAYTGIASVFRWDTPVYLDNAWTASSVANFYGSSTLNPFSLSVKRLANGHFAAISAVRTALDGSSSAGVGNLPRGTVRLDVYARFSDDEGATWGTAQNLTGYTGTPGLDLVGIPSAFDADLTELSDGTVVVGFQEGNTPQFINDSTSLAIPSNAGNATCSVYHATKNLLIVGTDNATNGGVWIFDLTAQTRTRLYTGSTPAIWGNQVKDLALSSDDKYLAVAHVDGLEIIDTTDSTISNWTDVPIRTTTTPASIVARMAFCAFDSSGYTLYVAYGAASGTNIWGFLTDASSPTVLTNLLTSTGGNQANVRFVVNADALYCLPLTGRIGRTNKSTGVNVYTTNVGGSSSWANLVYDDVNNEFVIAGVNNGGNNGIHRVRDTGSAFSVVASFYATSNPSAPTGIAATSFVGIPGSGVFYSSGDSGALSTGFYSFGHQAPMGVITFMRYDQAVGENEWNVTKNGYRILKSKGWRFSTSSFSCQLIDLKTSGRIRYGFFAYVAGTKQLTTSGVDFYDMVNGARVGIPYTNLQKLRFTADATDTLIAYFRKVDFSTSIHQYAAMNGYVEPDAYKLFMRARILVNQLQTLQMRARIRNTYTQTLDIRARIVFAQCLKMRARIVPINTVTFTARARILGQKQSTLLNIFYVQRDNLTRVRMEFFAGNGYALTQSLNVGARIVKQRSKRFTNHLIVYNVQGSPWSASFNVSQRGFQQFSTRANISRP